MIDYHEQFTGTDSQVAEEPGKPAFASVEITITQSDPFPHPRRGGRCRPLSKAGFIRCCQGTRVPGTERESQSVVESIGRHLRCPSLESTEIRSSLASTLFK